MNFLHQFLDIVLNLNLHLNQLVIDLGPWVYVVLFLIIFCETGLVVMPFLPGDSLLFALGALTSVENAYLRLDLLAVLLVIAGILGDAANYSIGKWMGPKIFRKQGGFWFRKDYLMKTQAFYDRHGGKTIIFARFMPIVRTFAPFVAGIGRMPYPRFFSFNVIGAILWVGFFLGIGHFFGELPIIKRNFHTVILAIVVISFMPGVIEYLRSRRNQSR